MSHGTRRTKSARLQNQTTSLPTLAVDEASDDGHNLPPPPPRKDRKRRQHQKRTDPDERTSTTTVASGRTSSSHAREEGAEEEDEDDADEAAVSGAGRLRHKRNRSASMHLSPDIRKRRRSRRQAATAHTKLATTAVAVEELEPSSGDERDVSDFDLDGDEDDEDMLDIEARHIIDDVDSGNQSSDGDSDDEDLQGHEGIVFEITGLHADAQSVDGEWSDGARPRDRRAELEDLLALADEPLEGGVISSIWYQEAGIGDDLDNLGDSDSDGSGGSASEADTDEAADQLLLMRSFASDSDDQSLTDDGDTTDSLDDGDELALIRFGIEVDEAEASMTVAPMQNGEMTLDMAAFADNPDAVIAQTASSLGIDHETAARIITGVGLSVIAHHENESGNPCMGEFTAVKPEGSIVVDSDAAPVPSPFSVRRSARNRRQSDASPSRPTRRSSIVSSSSLSQPSTGPLPSPALSSPLEVPEDTDGVEMDLDDVLHATVLDSEQFEASSESEAVEDATDLELANGGHMADLSRWDRVPIGAFRRSRVHGSRSPLPDAQFYLPFTTALFRGSPVLLPVQHVKAKAGKSGGVGGKKKGKKAIKPTAASTAVKGKRVPSSLRKVVAQANYLSSSPRPTRSKTGTPQMRPTTSNGISLPPSNTLSAPTAGFPPLGSPLFSSLGSTSALASVPPLNLADGL